MKRAVISILAIIISISFCMAQNIKEAAEQQKQRELQQQQAAEEQRKREAQQRQAAEELAKNSYMVTFDSDGGSAVTSQSILKGSTALKPVDPVKANHAFVEWRMAGESKAFDFSTPVTAPITLRAVWVNLAPTVTVTQEGTVVSGSTLARKLEWLTRTADSHNTYIIVVNADENIPPHTLQFSGAINITVILRGDGTNRTIRLSANGNMFTVRSEVTFILDNNVTLQGHRRDRGTMVAVEGGTLIMNAGSSITGNAAAGSNLYGSGVNLSRGTFTMNGGTISGNAVTKGGGGVYVGGGTFTMNGGAISDNSADSGGGVYVGGGTFTMTGGTIYRNIAAGNGGGVYVRQYAGTFTKRGGAIIGYNSDPDNGNTVNDGSGLLARRGHAVWFNENRRRETTVGQGVYLTSKTADNWDDNVVGQVPALVQYAESGPATSSTAETFPGNATTKEITTLTTQSADDSERKTASTGQISVIFAGCNDLTKEEHGEIPVTVYLETEVIKTRTVKDKSGKEKQETYSAYENKTLIGSGTLKEGFVILITDPRPGKHRLIIGDSNFGGIGTKKIGDDVRISCGNNILSNYIAINTTVQNNIELTVQKKVNNKGVTNYTFN